jgi:hypothetical protein
MIVWVQDHHSTLALPIERRDSRKEEAGAGRQPSRTESATSPHNQHNNQHIRVRAAHETQRAHRPLDRRTTSTLQGGRPCRSSRQGAKAAGIEGSHNRAAAPPQRPAAALLTPCGAPPARASDHRRELQHEVLAAAERAGCRAAGEELHVRPALAADAVAAPQDLRRVRPLPVQRGPL